MDLIVSSGSVFSVSVWILLLVASLYYCECELASMKLRILSSILEMEVATMVLIDAASNDDSNGGQFVIWSNLDLCCENPAVGWILTELSTNLTCFRRRRLAKSPPIGLIICLIDRGDQGLSIAPPFAFIGPLQRKI